MKILFKQCGEWAIKLKNNRQKLNVVLKILLLVGGVSVFFVIIYRSLMRKRIRKAVSSEDGIKVMIAVLIVISLFLLVYVIYLFNRKKQYEKVAGVIRDVFDYDKNVMVGNKMLDQELLRLKENMEMNKRKLEMETRRTKDFIMYLAHDLKTPLASVIGYLNLLGDITDLPIEQQEKFIHLALEKAERLEFLIEEFFDITRFGMHEVILYMDEVDLTLLIEQLIDEFYPMVELKGQTILYHGPESLIVTVDGEKIARVLNNVLKNASTYGDRDSIIHLAVSVTAGIVSIKVMNTGKKIPADQIDRLFEKFYRLDQSRSTQTGGAGLGLAIAKEIVEAHRGRIYAESEEYQTTFIIELPIS